MYASVPVTVTENIVEQTHIQNACKGFPLSGIAKRVLQYDTHLAIGETIVKPVDYTEHGDNDDVDDIYQKYRERTPVVRLLPKLIFTEGKQTTYHERSKTP